MRVRVRVWVGEGCENANLIIKKELEAIEGWDTWADLSSPIPSRGRTRGRAGRLKEARRACRRVPPSGGRAMQRRGE